MRFRPAATLALFLAMLALLGGCGGLAEQAPESWGGGGGVVPKMQIFVAPARPVDTSSLKVLVMPAELFAPQPLNSEGISRYVQSVFLQHRVFKVLECCPTRMSEAAAVEMARRRGFDLVLFPAMVDLVSGQGDSAGFVAMRFRLVRTKEPVTIWDIYGEAALEPEHDSYFLIWKSTGSPPPSVMTGVTVISRAAAEIVSGNPVTAVSR